jgi:hypothetical protein
MGEMSELFDCEIRHYWKSVDEGFPDITVLTAVITLTVAPGRKKCSN